MTKDKREGWLKELKVEDVVGYVDTYTKNPKGYGVVRKITPAGKIDVGSYRFEPEGNYSSSDRWNPTKFTLVPFTKKHKQNVDEKILKNKLVNTLEDYDFTTLSLEQLKTIVEVIEDI